jgi:hypothetical protein
VSLLSAFLALLQRRSVPLEYNEPAARNAEAKVRAFLATHLGIAAANEPTAK